MSQPDPIQPSQVAVLGDRIAELGARRQAAAAGWVVDGARCGLEAPARRVQRIPGLVAQLAGEPEPTEASTGSGACGVTLALLPSAAAWTAAATATPSTRS